ncbi:MAG: alpha/beta hydrolase [Pseudomonadota bacterium]|nr:alpha/beta hydrolase [Pseudomonadota bacterium]
MAFSIGELQRTQISGQTLSWREEGEGETLLLLHGIGGNSQSWEEQLTYIANQYRVIAWDMPGYGGSDPLTVSKPTSDDYVDCLEALLNVLGVKKVHLLGQSIAALIGARFCVRNPINALSYIFAHGLVGLGGLDVEERERVKNGRLEVFEALGPKRFAYEKGPAIMGSQVSESARSKAVDIMAQVSPRGFRQAVEMLSTSNFFLDAPSMRLPSLVLCGAEDPVAPEKVCRSAQEALQDAKFFLLPNVGHYSAIENPILFNNSILEFLNNLH